MLMACIAAISPGTALPADPVKLQSCQTSPALQRNSSRPATAPLLAAVMPSDDLGTLSRESVVWIVDVRSRWQLKKGGLRSCRQQTKLIVSPAATQVDM